MISFYSLPLISVIGKTNEKIILRVTEKHFKDNAIKPTWAYEDKVMSY